MLRFSLLLLGLSSCSLLVPVFNAKPCAADFIPRCDGSVLVTCEAGFIHQDDCGAFSCNEASVLCEGCGDGVINNAEVCDDGNTTSGDGCDENCTDTACGNGVVTAGEQCDDGNLVDGDGCESDCTLPPPPGCGDGVVTAPEECDDTNLTNGDGCRSNCTQELCPDGFQDPQEQCDDDNQSNSDACKNDCTDNVCGDNAIFTGTEDCDDGNNQNGDGCSSACQVESCPNAVGHDEDNDTIDDACDNCPTVTNTNQANALETQAGNAPDALGDACDPRPSVSGDSIAFFDGFRGATLSNSWSANSGTWTVSNDELVHADPVPFDLLNRVGFSTSRAVVEMRLIIDSFGSGTANAGIGVSMSNATNGVVCTTGVLSSAPVLRLAPLVNGTGGAPRQQQSISDPVGIPIVTLAAINTNTVCTVVGETPAVDAITPPNGGVAIRAAGAAMRVQSFIVYSLGS